MRRDVPAAESRRATEQMALEQEWNAVLGEIRSLDGFADFLRPPRLDALSQAAAGGPVVVVNVSHWRSDALIVTTDGVQPPLPLPAASHEVTTDWALRYLTAVHDFQVAEQTAYLAQKPFRDGDQSPAAFQAYHSAAATLHAERIRMENVVIEVLDWLWTAIAEPVLTFLGFTETPRDGAWPRLWWCPTGLLTALPLHAAGRYADAPGHTVLDRVVPSYTPTLRALLEATKTRRPGPPTSPRCSWSRRPTCPARHRCRTSPARSTCSPGCSRATGARCWTARTPRHPAYARSWAGTAGSTSAVTATRTSWTRRTAGCCCTTAC